MRRGGPFVVFSPWQFLAAEGEDFETSKRNLQIWESGINVIRKKPNRNPTAAATIAIAAALLKSRRDRRETTKGLESRMPAAAPTAPPVIIESGTDRS
jgi:hypothetical protein